MAGNGMKRLAKDTAIYGTSSIVGRFLNWWLVPYYTRILSDTADYGIVTNIYGITALLTVLLTYGMETGFFRFANKKEENPMSVYSTSMISIGFTSLLFIGLVFIFINPISAALNYSDYKDYLEIMAITVAIDAFMSIPFAYLRYKNRPIRFASIKLLFVFMNIILNVFFLSICPAIYKSHPEWISWFYRPDYGVGYIFVANLIATFTQFLFLLPDITGFKYVFDKALLNRMLKYSFPLLILGIAGIMNQTIDKIIFPYLFNGTFEEGQEQLGIYGACFKIAVVMVMFTQAFRFAYEPFIFAKNKGEDNNKKVYSEAMKYFIIFSLLVFLAVMFYIDIVKYFVGKDYYEGIKVVPIVMMGMLFFGIYFNLSLWYKLTDDTKWGAYFSVIGFIIMVGIMVIFVPVYGYIACAWASFFCNFVMMLLSYFLGQKYYPINYNLKSIGIYFLLFAVLYIAGMYVPIENEVIRLIYRTVLLGIFIVYMVKKDVPLKEIPFINKLKVKS